MGSAAGAGVVVWGAVYRTADSLLFQSQITDLRTHWLLSAIGPVSLPVADATFAASELRSRITGAMAVLMDRRVALQHAATEVRPPTFDSYREYVIGLRLFEESRYVEALPHFAAAVRLDSTFSLPLVWSRYAYVNSGNPRSVIPSRTCCWRGAID